MIQGKSHAQGGIKVRASGKTVEVEGGEYYLTKACLESGELHEFEGKTNRQILDHLSKTYGVHFDGKTMRSGDFIVCKPAVKDSAKQNITGTVKEILNTMQAEKGCNVSDDCHYCPKEGVMQKGGNLDENDLSLNGKQGHSDMETTEKKGDILYIVPGNTIKSKNRTFKIISVGDEISVCPDEPFNESETITRPLKYFKEKFQQETFEIEGCGKDHAVCELNLIKEKQVTLSRKRKDQEREKNLNERERWRKSVEINNELGEGGQVTGDFATEILRQLGGKKFIAMTGANTFLYDSERKYLSFRTPKNQSGANHVRITLDPSDTYTMEFGTIKVKDFVPEYKMKEKIKGLYADQLQPEFTKYTGLDTTLAKGGVISEEVQYAKGGPLCPEGTQIQSLIFEKAQYHKAKAKAWAKKHHFQYGKTDEQENTYRIRQELPRKFRKDSFRTIPITKGIQATVACPK